MVSEGVREREGEGERDKRQGRRDRWKEREREIETGKEGERDRGKERERVYNVARLWYSAFYICRFPTQNCFLTPGTAFIYSYH